MSKPVETREIAMRDEALRDGEGRVALGKPGGGFPDKPKVDKGGKSAIEKAEEDGA